MVVTFDLFGTLVEVTRPDDPGTAVATALRNRSVDVPNDWDTAYRESHVDVPDGAEISLPEHVHAALESRGYGPSSDERDVVECAVRAAFEPVVSTRPGARDAVEAAGERGPVGILSNCSVPGLVRGTIEESALDPGTFDAVVGSVGCGWRKPDPRAFEAVATSLGVPTADLVHVGDDPETDGGAAAVGATAVLLADVPLREVAVGLREGRWE